MIFETTILGCGAAAPTGKHSPSAQVLNIHDKLFLVDCGEGTQMQMRKFKVKMQRINEVFITHMHGDHYLGLMGFISSMHLLGRKAKLTVYGPAELKPILELQLKASQTFLEYPLEVVAVDSSSKQCIYDDKSLRVYSFPMKHRIECCGYLFEEKERKPKITKESIATYGLIPSQIIQLKNGQSVVLENGNTLEPETVCEEPEPPKRYAYCSDTAYSEKVIDAVKGCSTIYHESTFLESEAERAKSTFHSTAKQAGKVAKEAGAKRLILGHFSSRYATEDLFKVEAAAEFSNVSLANEGMVFTVH
ncbi:MAG: ribonuclease Z [Flavobacteriales bacterium]|jgi:ribonuclease Z